MKEQGSENKIGRSQLKWGRILEQGSGNCTKFDALSPGSERTALNIHCVPIHTWPVFTSRIVLF